MNMFNNYFNPMMMNNPMQMQGMGNNMPSILGQNRPALPTAYFPSLFNNISYDSFGATKGFQQVGIMPNIKNFFEDVKKNNTDPNYMPIYGSTAHRRLAELTALAQGDVEFFLKPMNSIGNMIGNSPYQTNDQQTSSGSILKDTAYDATGGTLTDVRNIDLQMGLITQEAQHYLLLDQYIKSPDISGLASFLQSMGVPASMAKTQAMAIKNAILQNPQLEDQLAQKRKTLETNIDSLKAQKAMIEGGRAAPVKNIQEPLKLT